MPQLSIKTKFKNAKYLELGYGRFSAPSYVHSADSGMDVRADVLHPAVIRPNGILVVPTGLYVSLPASKKKDWVWELQVRPRSGLAASHGVTVANTPGTIDAGYTGELKVILLNTGLDPYIVNPGDRIAQIVLSKSYRVSWKIIEELPETDRNSGGFGSTGK